MRLKDYVVCNKYYQILYKRASESCRYSNDNHDDELMMSQFNSAQLTAQFAI